ncbi:hypothetical protein BpHYR1_014438 [Brachionus plicatilis]|uniref:Uncharacterized protein n=1 Tax=Brachionus plicatilis TaxID=10195 RepID=A0A3M7RK64_BRAPC|nr:hypothetical protein BpHYR1_014438 [Brachionus plicatilis]
MEKNSLFLSKDNKHPWSIDWTISLMKIIYSHLIHMVTYRHTLISRRSLSLFRFKRDYGLNFIWQIENKAMFYFAITTGFKGKFYNYRYPYKIYLKISRNNESELILANDIKFQANKP